MRNSLIMLAIAICTISAHTQAKELYVNAGAGDDRISYENNSAATPWRSLGRAVWGNSTKNSANSSEAARAGDTVIVAAGTYGTSEATNLRYLPIYNPVNSGTVAAPIVFRADGVVHLTATAGAQPIIGTYQKSYIVWDGFTLNEATIPTKADTGPMVVWHSNHVTVQNMHIIGVDQNWADNHTGLRLEYANDIVVKNNRIEGFRDAGMNSACIQTYDAYRLLIEHNECFNSSAGIFIKGVHGDIPQHDIVARFNYIHDVSDAFILGGIGGASAGNITGEMSYIYQNLVTDASSSGVTLIGYDGYSPSNITIANNTFHRIGTPGAMGLETGGILLRRGYTGYSRLHFYNNLITDSTCAIASPGGFPAADAMTFGHNNYYGNDTVVAVSYNRVSFDNWRSTYGKDTVGTTLVNPQYVNSSDLRLANDSSIRERGLDVLDLNNNGSRMDAITIGAYITGNEVMGPTIVANMARPSPPTNLQVIP